MMPTKQKKPMPKGGLLTSASAVSSAGQGMARSMNSYTEQISPSNSAVLWSQLTDFAKDVLPRTTWGQWVNGTISEEGLQAAVTACTTPDGFVLNFIVSDTSKSDGAKNEQKTT